MRIGRWLAVILAAGMIAPVACRAQSASVVHADEAFLRLENVGSAARPGAPVVLSAVHDPSGNYPLRISVVNATFRYYGRSDVPATGVLALAGTRYRFRVNCGSVFGQDGGDYEARWVKDGKKLEIVMSQSGSGHQSKCIVTTVAVLNRP